MTRILAKYNAYGVLFFAGMLWDEDLAGQLKRVALHPDLATCLDALYAIFTQHPNRADPTSMDSSREFGQTIPALEANPPAQMTAAACILLMQREHAERLQADKQTYNVAQDLLHAGIWDDVMRCISAALMVSGISHPNGDSHVVSNCAVTVLLQCAKQQGMFF